MNKCVFLDRDGVLNEERGDYVYRIEDFIIPQGVKESLEILKSKGFILVAITNQAGIAKGIYTKKEVLKCFEYLQKETGFLIDALYYSPYHPQFTESLSRKPDSLMLEKAIAKFDIDVERSWLIGDSDRDIEAGNKVGVRGIRINKPWEKEHEFSSLKEAIGEIVRF